MKRPLARGLLLTALLLALAGALHPPAASARPVRDLASGLVADGQLAEASGTRLDELTGCGGGGCDLTDNNTVGQTTGVIGSSALFVSANSESLSRADHATLSIGGDVDFTFSLWFYANTLQVSRLLVKWTNTPPNLEYSVLLMNTGELRFAVSPDGTAITSLAHSATVTTGQWYHIVVWHDATADTINMQVNGGTPESLSHTTGVADTGAAFQIGSLSGGAQYFDGRVDEVGFWKRTLTDEERAALYNGGAGCAVADWPTCEATPTPTETTDPGATPTDTPTPTNTPLATATPTITHTPSWMYVVDLDGGTTALIERRGTWGELAVFLALVMWTALYGLRWLHELADRRGD